MLSRFLSGLAGLSVSSPMVPASPPLKVDSPPSSSTPASDSRTNASSSSDDGVSSSDEKGKRPMASSTSEMPSDQTSDLTLYGSPEMRSGCHVA